MVGLGLYFTRNQLKRGAAFGVNGLAALQSSAPRGAARRGVRCEQALIIYMRMMDEGTLHVPRSAIV